MHGAFRLTIPKPLSSQMFTVKTVLGKNRFLVKSFQTEILEIKSPDDGDGSKLFSLFHGPGPMAFNSVCSSGFFLAGNPVVSKNRLLGQIFKQQATLKRCHKRPEDATNSKLSMCLGAPWGHPEPKSKSFSLNQRKSYWR